MNGLWSGAEAVGVKRTDLMRLSPEEVMEVFGVEVGSVGPITRQENAQVIFDSQVSTAETAFCGIGRPDWTLEIRLADLVRVTQGSVLPLVSEQVEN
jgi:Cys-tRNA(Pro)/Cys-tRNA(Cys) deacylase